MTTLWKTVLAEAATLAGMGITGSQDGKKQSSDVRFTDATGRHVGTLRENGGTIMPPGRPEPVHILQEKGKESRESFWKRFIRELGLWLYPRSSVQPDERAPLLVIDLETTGLPDRTPPELLRIVEVGAVVTDHTGRVMRSLSVLVWPGRGVVEHPSTQESMRIHGIERGAMERGIPHEYLAPRLIDWTRRVMRADGVTHATSYNRAFDFDAFLDQPWCGLSANTGLQAGRCLMLWAQDLMKAGKFPSIAKAAAWLTAYGHKLPAIVTKHRALDDATYGAAIEFALRTEQAKRDMRG